MSDLLAGLFVRRAAEFVETWGADQLVAVAARAGDSVVSVPVAVSGPGERDAAEALLRAARDEAIPDTEVAAYLRGVAAGYRHTGAARVESVWSGPSTHHVPVRATAQVLVDIVGHAVHELVLLTYSAKPYAPLIEVLGDAVERGVRVQVVVETLTGAGSALSGNEPAAAFSGLPKVELWHWPSSRRPAGRAKMHAKAAVADRRVLLVSSANLTQSGIATNIEAGLLVHGGSAPVRTAEHVAALQASGELVRLQRSYSPPS